MSIPTNLQLQTARKTAWALFRILTIGSIDMVYGEFESEDVKKIVLYKMETRTLFCITHATAIPFAEMLAMKDFDLEKTNQVIHALLNTTADDIRFWWNTGGKAKYHEYKAELKAFAAADRKGFVFRVNDTGFAKQIGDEWTIVHTPAEATAWNCATCVAFEKQTEVEEHFEHVRFITVNKDQLTNIIG